MNKGGAPLGNNNGGKNKVWSLAIEKALAARYGRKETLDNLMKLAEVMLIKCESGDMVALKELGDRVEGKIPQAIDQATVVTIITKNSEEVPFTGIREQAEKSSTPDQPEIGSETRH